MHVTALAPIAAPVRQAAGSRRQAAAPRQFRMFRGEIRASRRVVPNVCGKEARISARSWTARRLRLAGQYSAKGAGPMTLKLGLRDGALSAAVFGAILFALVSVDPRVRDHVSDLVGNGHGGVAPWGTRAAELGDALWSAARYQSIENAPLLVFATVGTVLTVFMLKS
jgi:hypothetical protein